MTSEKTSPIKTIVLATLLVCVICILVLPVPSWLVDIGVAASFSLAILMLIVTLFIEKPLDFSSFPTILLGALILRLSLNVASTKLIIGDGHSGTDAAGEIIEGFAMFIMSGSLAIGIVVFCVLLVVNFVVINKGATRMAEVGARFALDAMPGKQLAIDSDIASGAITHEEGKQRRSQEQAETTFFGSLDGTSKFVKGDAIAGLIITLLNLIVGLCLGIFSHKMSLGDAFSTYSILTVGDGLVSQIPAVLISLATAIILARGGATGTTDTAISNQLGKHPIALLIVATLLIIFAALPGLPALPFIGLGVLILILGVNGLRKQNLEKSHDLAITDQPDIDDPSEVVSDILEIEEIQIEFSPSLISMALDPQSGLEKRIANIRRHIALEFGVLVPEIHLTDSHFLPDSEYKIHLMNSEEGQFRIEADKRLVINPDSKVQEIEGEIVAEPVYAAPAKWLKHEDAEQAILDGNTVVDPAEIIATHLLDIIKRNLSRIFTFSALQTRLYKMKNLTDSQRSESNRDLIDAIIPDKISLDLLHSILRTLLSEGVSIRNIQLVIEATAEARQMTQNFEQIYANVRTRLAPQIVGTLVDSHQDVNIIQISQDWEDTFTKYSVGKGEFEKVGLPPDLLMEISDLLKQKLSDARATYEKVSIACRDSRRTFIKDIAVAAGLDVAVLSFGELSQAKSVKVVGVANP